MNRRERRLALLLGHASLDRGACDWHHVLCGRRKNMKFNVPITAVLLGISLVGCGSNARNDASSASSVPASQDDDPGAYGPQLGQAHVVRSLTIKVSGGMNEVISGKKEDGETTLSGECKPDLFANLSLDRGASLGDHGGIGFATKDPIKMGQVGEIALDWVQVDSFRLNNGNPESKRFFGNGGTLTLTTHNPSKGSRRLIGTIVAKSLEAKDGLQAKPVDVEVAFDAEFSCGVQ
jgi:hypothetical protein